MYFPIYNTSLISFDLLERYSKYLSVQIQELNVSELQP